MAKRPVHELRFGLVKATIWENSSKEGVRYNTSIVRLYKNGERWVESTQFGRDDLPLVCKVADLAHSWIYGNGAKKNSA